MGSDRTGKPPNIARSCRPDRHGTRPRCIGGSSRIDVYARSRATVIQPSTCWRCPTMQHARVIADALETDAQSAGRSGRVSAAADGACAPTARAVSDQHQRSSPCRVVIAKLSERLTRKTVRRGPSTPVRAASRSCLLDDRNARTLREVGIARRLSGDVSARMAIARVETACRSLKHGYRAPSITLAQRREIQPDTSRRFDRVQPAALASQDESSQLMRSMLPRRAVRSDVSIVQRYGWITHAAR